MVAWVDYPSGVPCGPGVTIPVEQCDPGDAAVNSACMDMCHYGGCQRGGQCVFWGSPGAGAATASARPRLAGQPSCCVGRQDHAAASGRGNLVVHFCTLAD